VDQRELIDRAKRGNHDAFAGLVDGRAADPPATRTWLRMPSRRTSSVPGANLPGLRDPARFDAWLHRLTVNACLDLVRRRRRRPIEVELSAIDSIDGPTTRLRSPSTSA
jgi:hypothetical protein